jgi:hypothetical protein
MREALGRLHFGWCVPLMLVPFIAGCPASRGTLSGQVVYNGKPVPGGLLTFVPSEPGVSPVPARIDENGNYEVQLPAGEMQISVDNRELKSSGKPPALGPPPGAKIPAAAKGDPAATSPSAFQRPPGTYVQLPEKYYRSDTSELKVTVKGGSQKHNVELK